MYNYRNILYFCHVKKKLKKGQNEHNHRQKPESLA